MNCVRCTWQCFGVFCLHERCCWGKFVGCTMPTLNTGCHRHRILDRRSGRADPKSNNGLGSRLAPTCEFDSLPSTVEMAGLNTGCHRHRILNRRSGRADPKSNNGLGSRLAPTSEFDGLPSTVEMAGDWHKNINFHSGKVWQKGTSLESDHGLLWVQTFRQLSSFSSLYLNRQQCFNPDLGLLQVNWCSPSSVSYAL